MFSLPNEWSIDEGVLPTYHSHRSLMYYEA